MNFKVITYSPDKPKPKYGFYVQSKGLWSGRPMTRPRPNSFIVYADSKEDKLKLFNYVYILWKNQSFEKELVGSVIPFLRIKEFKDVLKATLNNPHLDHSKIRFTFSMIVGLRRKQQNLNSQIEMLRSMENLYIRKYIRL